MHEIDIRQDEKALALYANFEMICELPSNKAQIEALIQAYTNEEPDFFSEDHLGWLREYHFDELDYEELTEDEMRFRLMVVMLRDLFIQSQFIDQNEEYISLLNHYVVPRLTDENCWGGAIDTLLDTLLNSIEVSVTIQPKNQDDAITYAARIDQEKASKAEWAAIWQSIGSAGTMASGD